MELVCVWGINFFIIIINVLLWERYKINGYMNSVLESIPQISNKCYNIIEYCEKLEEEIERTKQWNSRLVEINKKNE